MGSKIRIATVDDHEGFLEEISGLLASLPEFDVVARVRDEFKKDHSVNDIDGARIKFEGGWGLVRASNTQPVLVLRFEGVTAARRDEIRAKVEGRAMEVVALLGG